MFNKMQLLLVDDEPLVLDILGATLRDEGYDVVNCSTGDQAIHLLDRMFFDVLISDVALDDWDGFDLLSLARSKNPRLGCVLITGSPDPEGKTRAQKLNAAYLTKPISLDRLLGAVRSVSNTLDGSNSQAA